jgi:hypothetical protein
VKSASDLLLVRYVSAEEVAGEAEVSECQNRLCPLRVSRRKFTAKKRTTIETLNPFRAAIESGIVSGQKVMIRYV